MSLYAYCVSDEVSEGMLAGARGLGGAPLALVERGGLAAVVSRFDEEPAPVTREHVVAHNRVNAQVLARTTPLPFRFGAVAAEEKLAAYLSGQGDALRAALARVRGSVEMGVKVLWDAGEARREAAGAPETSGAETEAAAGRGTAFLLAKRREALGDDALRLRAEELSAWLERGLSGLVREARARTRPSEALVLRAAHLVERARVEEYRARLRELRGARPGLRFLISGPWPPYSFTGEQYRER